METIEKNIEIDGFEIFVSFDAFINEEDINVFDHVNGESTTQKESFVDIKNLSYKIKSGETKREFNEFVSFNYSKNDLEYIEHYLLKFESENILNELI